MVNLKVFKALEEIGDVIQYIAKFGEEAEDIFYLADIGLTSLEREKIADFVKLENVFPEIKVFPDPTNEDKDSVLFRISFSKEHYEVPFFILAFRISGEGTVSVEEERGELK